MYDSTAAAIGKRLDDHWDATIAKIFAENLGSPKTGETASWVRFSFRIATRVSIDIGAITEREVGVIYFQVFTPEGGGTRDAQKIARHIGTILNEARFATSDNGAVICRRVQGPFPAGKDNGWIQQNCTVQIQADAAAVNAS